MSWKDFDLAKLVIRALMLGPWKNTEEVEECLCLPELIAFLKAHAEDDFSQRKFAAALKGVELPDPNEEDVPTFEEIKERARRRTLAQRAGITEEQADLMMLGIDYEG